MKLKKDTIVIVSCIVALCLMTVTFFGIKSVVDYIMYDTNIISYDESNIHIIYDSKDIIGKTRNQIIWKYGKFDLENEETGFYFVNYDNGKFPSFMSPSYIHDNFIVVFDDNNVAVDAYFRRSVGG